MPDVAEHVASVSTLAGPLHVVRAGDRLLISDHQALAGTCAISDPGELRDVLIRAADEGPRERGAELVGTVGRVHVLRFHSHVTVHDAPDPRVHSGWTMHLEQARELGEALTRAAGAPSGS